MDGGPFVPGSSLTSISLGEGVHRVRAFAVDVAGNRSGVTDTTWRVDTSAPHVEPRLLSPDPAANGWYRRLPLVALRADDGAQGSGVVRFERRIDLGAWVTYEGPFTVPEGTHTVSWRAKDTVGLERTGSTTVNADVAAQRRERRSRTRSSGPACCVRPRSCSTSWATTFQARCESAS